MASAQLEHRLRAVIAVPRNGTTPRQTLVDARWRKAEESRRFFFEVVKRQKPGVLYGPTVPPGWAVATKSIKVIVSGMAGVGKSSLVRALSACAGNSQVGPTMGLQVVSIPWGMRSLAPERTNAELLLLHIEFWDVGAIALRRFSHLKEEQEREPSVIMYVASAVDASSYSWALAEIAKKPTQQPVPGRLLVITKCDLLMQSHILWRDIDSLLQANPTLPVIGVSGANCTVEATSPAEEESIGDILDEITNQAFLSC